MSKRIPEKDWKWFGFPAHFICAQWCRFHMATQIGDYIVSTVGQYIHPRHSMGSERAEAKWRQQHPNGEEIGVDRFYETMVFKAGPVCASASCGCGLPEISGHELDFKGYQNAGEATRGHMEICKTVASGKFARAEGGQS